MRGVSWGMCECVDEKKLLYLGRMVPYIYCGIPLVMPVHSVSRLRKSFALTNHLCSRRGQLQVSGMITTL